MLGSIQTRVRSGALLSPKRLSHCACKNAFYYDWMYLGVLYVWSVPISMQHGCFVYKTIYCMILSFTMYIHQYVETPSSLNDWCLFRSLAIKVDAQIIEQALPTLGSLPVGLHYFSANRTWSRCEVGKSVLYPQLAFYIVYPQCTFYICIPSAANFFEFHWPGLFDTRSSAGLAACPPLGALGETPPLVGGRPALPPQTTWDLEEVQMIPWCAIE